MKRRKKIRTIKTKKFWLSIIALVVIIGAMYVLMLPQGLRGLQFSDRAIRLRH